MPAHHNVLRSKVILGNAEEITQLPWAHGAEMLELHAQNDPTKIYSLVVEYEPESGTFELCTEWRYADGFGGDVLQARTIEDVFRQTRTMQAHVEKQERQAAQDGVILGP